MATNKSNHLLVVSALLIGGLTYFILDNNSKNSTNRSVDETVEFIARESNQRPQTEIKELESPGRNTASVDPTLYQLKQRQLSDFSKSDFSEPEKLLNQLDKISDDILKSDLPMDKKAELNNELHSLVSKKMSLLKLPKVIDTRLDEHNNIIYPVFDNQ